MSRRLDRWQGAIAAGAFGAAPGAPGEQVIVGLWRASPLGRVVDVMWVRPDGERVLLAPSAAARDYIGGLYAFDRALVVPVTGGWDGGVVAVAAGGLRVRLVPGPRDWRSWLFASRPRRLLRQPWWVAAEDRLARPAVGRLIGGAAAVRAVGTAPGGQREWYAALDVRPVVAGDLAVEGRDAGALSPLRPDLRVGPSAFPTRPAIVHVETIVEQVAR